MLQESINFIKGCVRKNNPIEVYQYVSIDNGMLHASNGIYEAACPVGLANNVLPKAEQFFAALLRCQETTAISKTATGNLTLKSGKFSATVPCGSLIFPSFKPVGERIPIADKFSEQLKDLTVFMVEDNHHTWANGVMFSDHTALVTDNVVIVQKKIAGGFPFNANIPHATVKELIRIKENPIAVEYSNNRITFHYREDKWLSSTLVPQQWPASAFEVFQEHGNAVDVDQEIAAAVKSFKGKNNIIRLEPGKVVLEKEGAEMIYEVSSRDVIGKYDSETLNRVLQVAKHIDLSCHPHNSIFFSGNLRGVMAGIRS